MTQFKLRDNKDPDDKRRVVALPPAAPARHAADTVVAFSDSRIFQPLEATQQFLASSRRRVCRRTRRVRRMSLRTARRRVERSLRRKVGRRALRRLERSGRTRTAARAEDFAVAALGARSPGAALAALLIAHEEDPRDGRHLIGAAALLGPLGMPNEAIAFATAGDRLVRRTIRRRGRRWARRHRAELEPFGVSQRALAYNARGYALITLGREREALRLLRRAARSEPLFAEARRNVAVAELCRGRTQVAAQAYRQAVHRQQLGQTVGGPQAGGQQLSERYPPEEVFDLSMGVEAELPPVEYPETPEAAAASHDALDGQGKARDREAHELRMQAVGIQPNLPETTAGRLRWADLNGAIGEWEADPELKAGFDGIVAQSQALSDFAGRHFDEARRQFSACEAAHPKDFEAEKQCSRDWCIPATAARHEQWLPDVRRLDAATRAWGRAYYRRQTGLAANFADENARDTSVLWSRGHLVDVYATYLLTTGATSWTFVVDLLKEDCVPQPAGSGGETGDEDLPSVPACPPELKALKLTIKLGVFDLGVNCEQVEAKVAGAGVIAPFAQVEYRFRDGQTTVYGGVEGKAGFASADAGIYVSFDAQGNVGDVGARASTGGSAGGGPIGLGAGGESLNWSFAPALL